MFGWIGDRVKDVGDFAADHWDDALSITATTVGFALGGPAGSLLAGAAVGGITAAIQGENILKGVGFGALEGIPFAGRGVRGALRAKGSVQKALNRADDLRAKGKNAKADRLVINQSGRWKHDIPIRMNAHGATPVGTYLGLSSSLLMTGIVQGGKAAVGLMGPKGAPPSPFGPVPVIPIGKARNGRNAPGLYAGSR